MRKIFSLLLALMATTATVFSSVVTFDADTDKGNATETAAAFTKVLDFTNNSKAMYYISDLGLRELQISNFDGEYSVSFDILYIDQVMGGEFDMTNMWEEQTFLIHRNSPVKFAEFDGKIWQKNDTTYLTASILGLNSIQYEISMFYTVPTPTETVTYTFDGLGNDEVKFENEVVKSGIFKLEAQSADDNLKAMVNVAPIETKSVEGTFYNDGKFDHTDFSPTDTWVKVWNASTKEYDEYSVQKGTMTVTVENKILTAVASFICDNAVQYNLTFVTQYEREHIEFDSEEGEVDYTYAPESQCEFTTDYVESDNLLYFDILAADSSSVTAMAFFVDHMDDDITIPEGVYPINGSRELGTVYASPGVAGGGPIQSYFCYTYVENGHIWYDQEGLYCLVDGTVTVEKVDGKMKLTVDAFNSYDVSVSLKIVYDPGFTLTVLSNDATMGYVSGSGIYKTGEVVTISATSNQGYHFVQWSDGVTDNPRTFVITQDTTFTAEFAPNKYTITTVSSDTQRGTTQGDTTVNYLEYITISATASYGYHFTQWNDANVENPRQVQVTGAATYIATFDKNTYAISLSCNEEQGSVEGVTSAEYLDTVTISATPNFGYHFVKWSDGSTDTIRTLVLTQDTILTAEFAQTFSGQCGENLYWSYDETAKTVSITGSGKMYDYTATTQPWLLFKEEIKEVIIANTATSIGTSAFEGCIRLGKLSIGTGMVNIGANAFAGCTRLYHIYCYPTYPPFADESSFANYNVYLHVPCNNKEEYDLDIVWGKFKFIECLSADEVEDTEDVEIDAGSTDVTITWPTEEGADTYTLVIKKDGEIFCTLTFNSEGQLISIAFAPGRDGNHPAQYAEAVANGGYRFTVTGLEEGTDYTYDITVKDASNQTIHSHTGAFTTQSTTAVDNVTTNSANTQKLLRNGQLIILRDGVEYNAMGAEIQ